MEVGQRTRAPQRLHDLHRPDVDRQCDVARRLHDDLVRVAASATGGCSPRRGRRRSGPSLSPLSSPSSPTAARRGAAFRRRGRARGWPVAEGLLGAFLAFDARGLSAFGRRGFLLAVSVDGYGVETPKATTLIRDASGKPARARSPAFARTKASESRSTRSRSTHPRAKASRTSFANDTFFRVAVVKRRWRWCRRAMSASGSAIGESCENVSS